MARSFLTGFFSAIISLPAIGYSMPVATITVDAGEYSRQETPVSIGLEAIAKESSSGLILREVKGDKRIAVNSQIEAGKSPRLWWVLDGQTAAGEKRIYELLRGKSTPAKGIEVKPADGGLEIYRDEAKVLRYNHAQVMPPEGASELYVRSGFIHPMWSPAGEVLTQIHPKDHIHHMGLWNPWTKVGFEGRELDFWNLKKGQGTVRFVKFISRTSGTVFGGFEALQEHVDLQNPKGQTVALNERLKVRIWNTKRKDNGYLIDYTTTQRCATDEAFKLQAYRYGGFGFRATDKWKGDNRNYLTSEGKTIKDADGSRARWCNVFGAMEKGQSGLVFMSHPENRQHPEPVRIWGEDFNDVFFNYCPIKKKPWQLEPKKDYVLKYRIYVYDGNIDAAGAERLWRDFAYPPKVSMELTNSYSKGQELSAKIVDSQVVVSIAGEVFTCYKFESSLKKPYFWPVNGPASGNSITAESAEPYPHHNSLFFGCDRVNGGNYWQDTNQRGQIVSQGPKIIVSSPGSVIFHDECLWKQPNKPPVIHDSRVITITAPDSKRRFIDFEITLLPLVDIHIERTNHSLFSARVVHELSVKAGGTLVNAQGNKGEKGTWGVESPWCDYHGSRNDITEGIAILQHPGNRWFPAKWFTRDYGFFSPTPMYWPASGTAIDLPKGRAVTLRYRVVVHRGDTKEADIAGIYSRWSAH
jgi:hypothetical protein